MIKTLSLRGRVQDNICLSSEWDDSLICPRCGGKLLLRTAKKGQNTGKYFYGCANFPQCRI
ncbi:topoisomerase DNA-binding C4 zinc finger domain-containing protein [Holdemania massiliensis]|uniref:topoisomerase DNA-binding C4 zinc finger domain-containing protein n=1 Tax=Holdemania massiliensis TaxID=1468449 RepID=UPI003561CC02